MFNVAVLNVALYDILSIFQLDACIQIVVHNELPE